MRLFPEGIGDLDLNIRWLVPLHLRTLKEAVLGPQAPEVNRLSSAKWLERACRAAGRRDRKAEERALAEYTKARVSEWLPEFSERRLLTDLYQRENRRKARSGSPDSRRRPSHGEGLRVARALLVDVQDATPLDPEQEAADVARTMATQLLPPMGTPTRQIVRAHIRRSVANRVYFDALWLLYEDLRHRHMYILRPMAKWRQEVADGRRQRPTLKPIPAHRPAHAAQVSRDIHIQFTLEVLCRTGIRPRGRSVSGCRIVGEVVGLSEKR